MSKRNSGNNPEEKTDLRIRRTKKSIRDAFFELIDENGFDSVTVKDITDRALISRNTFYLHYEDKFDLLNKISNELMRKVYWRVSKDLIKIKDLSLAKDKDIDIKDDPEAVVLTVVTVHNGAVPETVTPEEETEEA